jgi:plasmid stabilization system protein ParE
LIIEWLPAAQRDFDAIIDFIAADNPAAAINQAVEIEQQLEVLIEYRHRGRAGRVKGTRGLVIVRTPFIAAYCRQTG